MRVFLWFFDKLLLTNFWKKNWIEEKNFSMKYYVILLQYHVEIQLLSNKLKFFISKLINSKFFLVFNILVTRS